MQEYCANYILMRIREGSVLAPGGCQEWQRTKNNAGYGLMSVTFDKMSNKRIMTSAHRAHYMAAHKVILNRSQIVCHKCDNPLCVRLDHLFLGSHKMNARDCVRKGRRAKHYAAHSRIRTLSDDTIKAIAIEAGTLKQVANKYNVSYSYVSRLRNGKAKQFLLQKTSCNLL